MFFVRLELFLFVSPFNDLPSSLLETGSYLYADDTFIFYQHEDVKKIESILKSFCRYASGS